MKVAILGYARDGKAAYEYWSKSGDNELTICDINENLKVPAKTQTKLGPDYLRNLNQYDLLVRTAGLKPRDIIDANPDATDIQHKITSNTNEFLRVCPTKNVIGVTGTKGKGTTSTLIAKMLEADNKKVHLGGNIGIPALELLKNDIKSDHWVVLEQSSFQLIDQQYSPHIAVCLMVVSEHMDWHQDMAEYATAKQQLFAHQKPEDIAIYLSSDKNSQRIASVGTAKKIPYFAPPGAVIEDDNIKIDGQKVCHIGELKLLGQHNWQNVCAAVTTVWQVTQNVEALRSVLTSFSGLEHRLEFIRELDGIKYYNDSFGTTPETAIVAAQAFNQPKVIILGGSNKGSDYTQLASVLANINIRRIILIGNTAHPHYKTATIDIEAALHNQGITNIISLVKPDTTTMDEIVRAARAEARSGDVVLLSTAAASFDLFKDYKDRGEQFKQAVLALA